MPLSPAAIGIIFNTDQTAILLVKRKDIPLWVLPGGGIESHETAEEAVKREIKEETGYEVQIKRRCAEYSPINRLAAFTVVFTCQIQEGEACLSPETSDIHFYPLQALPRTFFHVHREWLEDALTHANLVKKPLTGVTYGKVLKYFLQHPLSFMRYLFTRFSQ